MTRWPAFILVVLVAPLIGSTATAAAGASPQHGGPRYHRGPAYFAIACAFSHRNQDDPIVFPRQRNRSHDHTYFGNRSTDAFSTPDSLRAAGRTSCGLAADTAAYWAPTLFVGGRAVEPVRATFFYARLTSEPVEAFPAGLKVIAGDAGARSAQSRRVTYWSCGFRGRVGPSSIVPSCPAGTALHLHVNFPNCWDGRRLDSADHKSHMAYSANGACPQSHPVEVPALFAVVRYPVAGNGTAELSSGGQFSGHADFVNAWHQRTLERLVDRYLNRFAFRGRRP